MKADTVIYRIVWKDYPPDLVWYEPGENLGDGLIKEFEDRLAAEAEADQQAADEVAELEQLEEEEAMPAP